MTERWAEPSVEETLRSQGFKSSYQLIGNRSARIRQIQKALPPPLASALAGSLSEHINEVMEKVMDLRRQDPCDNSKRKAHEELPTGSLKKVRWSQES